MNVIALVGRLTADPELRYTPSGAAVATFTLAVDRQIKKDGQPTADFPNIVVWQKLAELSAQYLRKGSQAAVQGRLQTRQYEDKEGRKVRVTEVVAEQVRFLDPKQTDNQQGRGGSFGGDGKPVDISDDDLPF